ncbi:hypothetical protein ACFQV4_07240 [Streptomyces thermocarboxydus]
MTGGLLNYVSCGVLWLGLLIKAPDLLRHRRDPYLRAICAVLGLAGLCFFLGAPPTVGAVNRIGGVPNLAAPLTYAAITGYCAASQVLVVHWRGGPGAAHRPPLDRRVRRRRGGVAATFALGEAPVERRTDLDTYYATTPYIAQMIVLYLLAHLTAATVTAVSSLRWARRVRGGLRAGLLLLGAGAACGAGYSSTKLVAVAARWTGRDWTTLVTTVSRPPPDSGAAHGRRSAGAADPAAGGRGAAGPADVRPAGAAGADAGRPADPQDAAAAPAPLRLRGDPADVASDQHPQRARPSGRLSRPGAVRPHPVATLASTGDPARAEAAAWAAVITAAVRRRPTRGCACRRPLRRAPARAGAGAGVAGPHRRRARRSRARAPGARRAHRHPDGGHRVSRGTGVRRRPA